MTTVVLALRRQETPPPRPHAARKKPRNNLSRRRHQLPPHEPITRCSSHATKQPSKNPNPNDMSRGTTRRRRRKMEEQLVLEKQENTDNVVEGKKIKGSKTGRVVRILVQDPDATDEESSSGDEGGGKREGKRVMHVAYVPCGEKGKDCNCLKEVVNGEKEVKEEMGPARGTAGAVVCLFDVPGPIPDNLESIMNDPTLLINFFQDVPESD